MNIRRLSYIYEMTARVSPPAIAQGHGDLSLERRMSLASGKRVFLFKREEGTRGPGMLMTKVRGE